jgi:hypothetical protein
MPRPVTAQEAQRVWKAQRKASARSVAKALNQAGPARSFHDDQQVAKGGMAPGSERASALTSSCCSRQRYPRFNARSHQHMRPAPRL